MTWPSFPQYLKDKTARFGERVFFCDFDTEIQYTYREFDELTDQMAGGLRGLGVVKGSVVERLYREIRPLRIYEGTSEIQKVIIANHLFKEERQNESGKDQKTDS